MTSYYLTQAGSTAALTGPLDAAQAREIAVGRSAVNPGVTYELHGTNGHGGWVEATICDGLFTPAPRPLRR